VKELVFLKKVTNRWKMSSTSQFQTGVMQSCPGTRLTRPGTLHRRIAATAISGSQCWNSRSIRRVRAPGPDI